MADYATMTQDTDVLTEYVRHALSRSISSAHVQSDGVMPVVTLDRKVEETIQTAVQHRERGSYLALDPGPRRKSSTISANSWPRLPAASNLCFWCCRRFDPMSAG
jgi:type III secretory pathway component EscV